MKTAVYYRNSDIRIEEYPTPKIGPKELLVKIIASGICGSDVMEWYRIKKAPRVLGHEIAGEIVEVGSKVDKFRPGDRVFVTHHVPCNQCRYCRLGLHTACDTLHTTNFDPGGFSQYVRVPDINVRFGTFELPDEMPYDVATFIEPLGCVVRGQRVAGVEPGHVVAVIGSGISGLLNVKLARARGAGKIIATDINSYRRSAAIAAGANHVLDAREDVPAGIKTANDGRLADVVIVCTAAEAAFEQAFHSADRGGTILLFAPTAPDVRIPMPVFDLYFSLVKIVFSYAAVGEDIEKAIHLLQSNRLTVADMITHRLPLDEIQKGFDLVAAADQSMKVIIEPWQA
jgi:L-iditol 2-dehydrogenase